MELFSLLAKLTLDAKEYEKGLQRAKAEAGDIELDEPKLGLDDDEFTSKLESAKGESVDSMTGDKAPKLGLDNQEFNDNIDAAKEHGEGFDESIMSVFKGIKNALVTTGIVAAVTKVVNGIKEAVDLTAQTADGIEKGSKRLGISQKAYQEWDHALRQSGASINDVSKGIRNMQAVIVDGGESFKTLTEDTEEMAEASDDAADGLSKKVLSAYRSLGMESDIMNGKFQTTEELMEATMLALAGFEGTTEERGTIVRALFGNNADGLNALLDEGVDGVKDLMDEASRLGLVMSDDEIAQAVAYGDAVDNLNDELDAIKMAFVKDIIPALTDAVSWLTNFLTLLNPRVNTNSIFDVIDQIDSKAVAASKKVDESNVAAKKLIEDLQSLGNYWSLDEQGRMTWDALAAKALELFPQLSEFIDTDGKKIQGNTKDIEANIDAWSRLEKQRLLSAAMDEHREAVAKQLIDAYKQGAEATASWDEAEGKRLTAIEQFNKLVERGGKSDKKLGNDATYEEIKKARDELVDQVDLGNFTAAMDAATKDYLDAAGNAKQMREESEKQIADAEKAQSELDEYEIRLGETMGLTKEEILKTKSAVEDLGESIRRLPKGARVEVQYEEHENAFRHAIGSAYVPYDDYPALLHRGERVLTATEARQERSESIDLNALEERLVAAIRNGMENATVRSYIGEREVTDIVSQELANQLNYRRNG